MAARGKPGRIQTSLRLPGPLYEEARARVHEDAAAGSLNEFIIAAIRAYLEQLRRLQIDTAFSAMASDARYRKRALEVAEAFEQSDWEALTLAGKVRKRRHAPR